MPPTSIPPCCLPAEKFKDVKLPNPGGNDHYLQFVEACRGNGKTSAPFDYSGPLTESVLLGCLATRFPKMTLEWDPAKLQVTNVSEANAFVRRRYRKGWEVTGCEPGQSLDSASWRRSSRHSRYNIARRPRIPSMEIDLRP